MTYPYIAVGLLVIFIVYILYLLLIKRDMKRFRAAIFPGLFFIGVWALIYFMWLKD